MKWGIWTTGKQLLLQILLLSPSNLLAEGKYWISAMGHLRRYFNALTDTEIAIYCTMELFGLGAGGMWIA
jgi:hypothetical protein